ncbi:MAG: hypothetical protein IPP93_11690 [Chitinophagaceae bacterium]|nr:hypothetical protein [Chitinophagaceae bacterium]
MPFCTCFSNLTINNANTGTSSAVVWLASNGTDGASNNIVKNCNIAGASSTTTLIGIGAGSGATGIAITSLGTGNNNNTFENNNIKAVQFGIYSQGASAANKNSGNQFNMNLINTKSGSSQNVRTIGILAGFENSISVSGNNIGSISGGSPW